MGLTTRQRLMPLETRFQPIHEQEPAPAAAPKKKTPPAPEKLKPKKPRASGARRRKASKIAPAANVLAAEFTAPATPPPPAPETAPAG